jgi:hypothetical protein
MTHLYLEETVHERNKNLLNAFSISQDDFQKKLSGSNMLTPRGNKHTLLIG